MTERILAASALRTENGSGASIDLGPDTQLVLDLAVTGNTPEGDGVDESNTRIAPLFEAVIETSSDEETWRRVAAFSRGPKLRTERLVVNGVERFARCTWFLHPHNGSQGFPVGVTFSVQGSSR